MNITRIYHFEAAHQLPNHDGKCRNLHGHSYKLEVSVTWLTDGEVHGSKIGLIESGPKSGMMVDFGDLDAYLKPILDRLDHHYLNDYPELSPPTAEKIAIFIANEANKLLEPYGLCIQRIKLWETARSYVEVGKDA